MNYDELMPPEGDSVIINRNGCVIASIETLIKWTDDFLKIAEFRVMLGKNRKRRPQDA